MKTEREIKKEIKRISNERDTTFILGDSSPENVATAIYDSWVEALEWVLDNEVKEVKE